MKILLDTHIFLWLAAGEYRRIEAKMPLLYDTANTLYLSSISIAEIMIKRSLGKLVFEADILALLEAMTIEVLDFDGSSAVELAALPYHHRDPFDRMLIAQARVHALSLMSVDRQFGGYECDLV